jgi:hypothetical protein
VEFLRSKGIVSDTYYPLGFTGSPLLDDGVAVGSLLSTSLTRLMCSLLCRARLFPQSFPVLEAVIYKPFGIADKKGCVAIPKFVAPPRIDVNLNGFVNALGKPDEFDDVATSDKQARFIMPAWG